jgi:L-ascorbate metabolism protein UlaG (beta-lactamase superfamily)
MSEPALTVTLIGGPTALLVYGGLRLLTDPTFDDAPRDYGRAPAPSLHKTTGPALSADEVGDVDVVLLSHDHHPDNLDEAGRAFLSRAGRVLTTTAGAERVGAGATGMEPWETTQIGAVRITAVPAQHGPDGTDHLTGPVIGFVLRAEGLPEVYVSGDNASVRVVQEIVEREGPMEIAVLHAGGAALEGRFDGALLTLGAPDAAEAARVLGARAVVPVHQEGWEHFSVPPEAVRRAFDEADLAEVLVSLQPGQTASV